MQTTSQLNQITAAENAAVVNSPYRDLFALNEQGKIHSVHHEEYDTTGLIFPNSIEVFPSNVVQQKDGRMMTVVYKLDTEYKFLYGSTIQSEVPHIELKDEYKGALRVRLVENVAFKIAKECRFGSSDTDTGILDPYSQCALYDRMTPAGERKALDRDLGATTVCKHWTHTIEPRTLYAPQQYGYALCGARKPWPLYKQKKASNVIHEYKFKLDIIKFIEMQRLDVDGPGGPRWVEHRPEPEHFSVLPVAFSQPRFFCKVSDVAPLEMTQRSKSKNTNDFYIFRMVKCEVSVTTKPGPGMSVSIPIEGPGLAQAIFFSMENITHRDLNKTLNFTTKYHEDEWSKSSISTCSMIVAKEHKFKDLPSQLLDTQMNSRAFPSKGNKIGVHCHLFVPVIGTGNNGGGVPGEAGTVLKVTTDPSAPKGSVFKPRVRMLVTQRCTFEEDGTFAIV